MNWEAIQAFRLWRGKTVHAGNVMEYQEVQAAAAREAQILLKEYWAQSKQLGRAVELLAKLIGFHGASDVYADDFLNVIDDTKAFLRELEGSDRDHEGADSTRKIEENK